MKIKKYIPKQSNTSGNITRGFPIKNILAMFILFLTVSLNAVAQNLTIGSGSTVTNPVGTTLTITDLVISSGGTLVNNGTIVINGDWTNNGTYSGSGPVTFNGNNLLQTVSGSSTTNFGLITVNKGTSKLNIVD